jgi:hypothetical protein
VRGDLIVLWQREKVRPATFAFMTSAHQCSSRQSSHLLLLSSFYFGKGHIKIVWLTLIIGIEIEGNRAFPM